jgi:hypothetical protein
MSIFSGLGGGCKSESISFRYRNAPQLFQKKRKTAEIGELQLHIAFAHLEALIHRNEEGVAASRLEN